MSEVTTLRIQLPQETAAFPSDQPVALLAQTGCQSEEVRGLYLQRNITGAVPLDARFDSRAQDIYGGVDSKTVYFPDAMRAHYPTVSRDELLAARDALNDHGARNLTRIRQAYEFSDMVWLGLAGTAVAAVVSHGMVSSRTDTVRTEDHCGSLTRVPGTDVGIVGPKQDSDERITIAMGVADCLAIQLVDTETQAFGLAHAGRPGTSLHTAAKAVEGLEQCGSVPRNLVAYLGEGVCQACYTVDEKTIDQFIQTFGGRSKIDEVMRQHPGALAEVEVAGEARYSMNLYAFNKYLLASKGVGEIIVAAQCTARADTACVSLCGVLPPERSQEFYSHVRVKRETVGWTMQDGQVVELWTADLATPRNLTAMTRR